MPPQEELQTLLRFLTHDAKLPLARAMGAVRGLQNTELGNPEAIARSNIASLQNTFHDEKISKQVLSASKRICRKRTSEETFTSSSPSKRKRGNANSEHVTGSMADDSIRLPAVSTDEEAMSSTVLQTNRAPLVLAFGFMLLKYKMPEQPLSSRLSLAQAVVSVNSRSKAVSLGIESGKSAEDEGWGQGQPVVKIMGRDIRVLKRWNQEPGNTMLSEDTAEVDADEGARKADLDANDQNTNTIAEVEPALWGLDLEALRSSNRPRSTRSGPNSAGSLPIYTPQSARDYLLKSFASAPTPLGENVERKSPKKGSLAKSTSEREQNLGLLLGALELLFGSWSHVLSKDELDRRAWTWYLQVRPEVESGVAGWGAKGQVKLRDILDLRRKD